MSLKLVANIRYRFQQASNARHSLRCTVPTTSAADFNRDGIVDPDDLADFIGIYFGGC